MRRGAKVLALLGLPLVLIADVYWRQPVDLPQTWKQAYQTKIKLQNGEGDLRIFITGERLQGVENYLRDLHGDDLAWVSGEVMAWGMALQDGQLYRYLVQPRPSDDGGGFWVTVIQQSSRNAGRPGETPTGHQLKELPSLPGSTPTFYSLEEGTKAAVEISTSATEPDSALKQLSERMTGDGWQASPTNTGGFRLFVRRQEVAMISASAGKDGRTRILRLHKPLGVR